MNWLVFPTQALAVTACTIINGLMKVPIVGDNAATGQPDPKAQATTQWAIPQETLANTWVIPQPAASYLTGVVGFTVAAYDPTWFPTLTLGGGR